MALLCRLEIARYRPVPRMSVSRPRRGQEQASARPASRLSDKPGFTDWGDAKTLERAATALLNSITSTLQGIKMSKTLEQHYTLVYNKDTDNSMRIAHVWAPSGFLHALFEKRFLTERFEGEKEYYYHASAANKPTLFSIVYSLQRMREQAHKQAEPRLLNKLSLYVKADEIRTSILTRVTTYTGPMHSQMFHLLSPEETPLQFCDANKFEDAVHAVLDRLRDVYGADGRNEACQQIASDVELVRTKFVANLAAASAKLGASKRHAEWDRSVELNKRVALPLLAEPQDLHDDLGFKCVITQHLMQDPVLCTLDHITYERQAITKWLTEQGTSPSNPAVSLQPRQPVESVLVPNQALRDNISFVVPRMLAAERNGNGLFDLKGGGSGVGGGGQEGGEGGDGGAGGGGGGGGGGGKFIF